MQQKPRKPRGPITTRTLKLPLPPFPDGTGWALYAAQVFQEKTKALEELATTSAALGMALGKVAELNDKLQSETANVRRLEAIVQKGLADHHVEDDVDAEVEVSEEAAPAVS